MARYRTAFISHAHADNERCAKIAKRLNDRGIDFWIDLTNLQKSHSLPDDITRELVRRQTLVLMVTPRSDVSLWVGDELNNFLAYSRDPLLQMVNGQQRLVLPVLLETVTIPPVAEGSNWNSNWAKVYDRNYINGSSKSDEQIADEVAAALLMSTDVTDHLLTSIRPSMAPSIPMPDDLFKMDSNSSAERVQGAYAKTLPLLKRSARLTNDIQAQLDILHKSVIAARSLDRWDEALTVVDVALTLRPDDLGWQRQRLEALLKLNHSVDAQVLAELITGRDDATASDWLALAHAIRASHPNSEDTSDVDTRAQITHALDTASRLATRSQPVDSEITASIAQARRTLLPPSRITLPPVPASFGGVPVRLSNLDFAVRILNGIEVILPPLCDIPAGPFLMGSDKLLDTQARKDELPQHRNSLMTFQIARYPVTVAEYACAVQAGAIKEPPKSTNNSINWEHQLQQLDHPVVGVSRNDAVAYASWLSKVTGQPWRLPTEAEWEKAARGTDGRIYPWGNVWDKSRANTNDGGPRQTTAVGLYPTGASPFGVQDMAGNVWEWTKSLYIERYPYVATTSEVFNKTDVRVCRGGSWVNDPGSARAANRDVNYPSLRYVNLGFRLVHMVDG